MTRSSAPCSWPLLCIASLWLSACAIHHPLPASPHVTEDPAATTAEQATSAAPSLPADDPRFAEMATQIQQLQQQVTELQRQQVALSQSLSVRNDSSRHQGASIPAAAGTSRLQQAQQQYQAGLFAQVVRTLSGSDGGGNGSNEARQSMFLLMQSHRQLNNCESVINIGKRFASRFARHPQAAEALWLVGQCQWQMQQQDIARDTWRKLISTYPDSPAARRAHEGLQRRR